MEIARKNNNPRRWGEGKTVRDLLEAHQETSRLLTEGIDKRPVSIILLYDHPTPFVEKALRQTPHIVLRMEDDLFRMIAELHEENTKLRSYSLIDNLTGLFNSRFFWMQLEIEMARTKRTGHSCSLMIVDLDNFKLLNDTFGHLEGDRFLVEFGKILRDNSRSTDLICRYGGDEFALIMPGTSVTEAFRTGERLSCILAGMPQKTDPPVSLSIGISEYTAFSTYGMNEFVHDADAAMYEAKKAGKNGIRICEKWAKTVPVDSGLDRDEKEALLKGYEE